MTYAPPSADGMRRILSAWIVLLLAPGALAQKDGGGKGRADPGSTEAESKPAALADDDPDLPIKDLRAGGDARKRYVVVGPKKGAKPPRHGWKSLFVLPGGTGDAAFHPFVKNIARQVFSDEYVVVQLVSVRWIENQPVIWPTAHVKQKEATFGTEEFFLDVHKEVAKSIKLDPRCCFTLSWSSGGPAAYVLALMDRTPITGSYVAQSVFFPDRLPPLRAAKGKAFFLDHSPEDEKCRFALAEQARDALKKEGAHVELVAYDGGHGWHGAIWDRMKKGRAHLEKHAVKPAR
ncbi:MAG TPA: hypothetical protein VEI02_02000 [Planctomycetota bacterium]|nr:hypothetical protein [Planctomycetota bacterium]